MELTEVQKEADSAGRKAILFGLVALAMAGTVGYMLAHLGSSGPETQPVVVAAQEVAPLSAIKLEYLRVVQWPSQSMPTGTFAKPEDVVKTGQVNVNGLKPGEPVLAERLSTADRGLGMSQMVEPNMRAFVVRVDDTVATSEILHPGAVVDVVATLDDPKVRQPITKVILQNVLILGVGDSVEVERTQARAASDLGTNRDLVERHRVVTLMVNIPDVEMLTFASRNGKLDLSLRNNNDSQLAVTSGITMDKLLGRANKAVLGKGDVSAQSPEAESPPDAEPAAAAAPSHGSGRYERPRHRAASAASNAGPSIIRVNR